MHTTTTKSTATTTSRRNVLGHAARPTTRTPGHGHAWSWTSPAPATRSPRLRRRRRRGSRRPARHHFNVEGLVYPAGTVPPGDGFDPAVTTATGLWLCQGWFVLHPGRGLPHVATTQHYVLGLVTDDRPSPPDQLVSSGVEGGVAETVRAVAGGTGRYRKTRGQVTQTVIGTNTTTLRLVGEPAPNFRFRFEF